MPVSRKRKGIMGKRRKVPAEFRPSFEKSDQGIIRIKPEVVNRFRTSDDFIAMIRVARLSNALNYTMERIAQDIQASMTPSQMRAVWRNLYNAGGYVYEGLLLAEALRNDGHSSSRYFGDFNAILEDDQYARWKEITRVIRNSAAFHLDHHDRSTRKALRSIDERIYDFVSAEDDSLGAVYFNIADAVDLHLIIEEFRDGHEDDLEVLDEVRITVTDLLGHMARASQAFILGISKKMRLVT